jgi:hypothetical protein
VVWAQILPNWPNTGSRLQKNMGRLTSGISLALIIKKNANSRIKTIERWIG